MDIDIYWLSFWSVFVGMESFILIKNTISKSDLDMNEPLDENYKD